MWPVVLVTQKETHARGMASNPDEESARSELTAAALVVPPGRRMSAAAGLLAMTVIHSSVV